MSNSHTRVCPEINKRSGSVVNPYIMHISQKLPWHVERVPSMKWATFFGLKKVLNLLSLYTCVSSVFQNACSDTEV
jgi:hypothetical protein